MKRVATPRETKMVTIPGTTIEMERWEGDRHPLCPEFDPRYIFRQEMVEEVAYSVETGTNCMLVGSTGIGKSSIITQLAAFLNRPLVRVNLHGESDTTIFVGRDKPTEVEGVRTIVYEPGILARAMSEGFWFLADEWDAALQPVLFVFQSVLEDNSRLTLEDTHGTVVRPAPGFHFWATANEVGIASKDRLLYSGTNRINEATLDRFGTVCHVQPPEEELERQIVSQMVPDLDQDFVRAVVMIAHEVRNQVDADELSCTMSTRRCIDWGRAMVKFPPLRAAKLSVLNKLNVDDYKVIEGVIQRYFGS